MSLQTRVNAMERRAGGAGCPECGYYKGAIVEFRVVTEAEESARHGEESCRTCGRELSLTIDLGGGIAGDSD